MGLSFPRENWRDLVRGLESAAPEFGFEGAESCARWLLSSPLTRGRIEVLARHLTVGETYFFRESKTFEILRERLLPELIQARRETSPSLRIWSAGCCTGEEPYSIAILLNQMIPDLAEWKISILATDINLQFLQKAAAGVYGEWSFRGGQQAVRDRYFNKTKEGRYELLPEIKKMVTFRYFNLVEGDLPVGWDHSTALDFIFCRNVLMYFSPEQVKAVINKFHQALAADGWFIVSPSELSHTLFNPFVMVPLSTVTLYRKGEPQIAEPDSATEGLPGSLVVPDLDRHPVELSIAAEPEEPETVSAAYQQALALYEQGSYEPAVERLLRSCSQDRHHVESMILLARIYANQGRLADALRWSEEALLLDSLNEGAHYLRALILEESEGWEEAELSLRRTIYLNPNFILAHYALGNLALRQGRTKESLKHFENALALLQSARPEDPLPGSDGLTAGRLAEVVRSTINQRLST
ncbi:MAG TPA: CheR family methyltransferase [Blastocatellia bacterium]|nr:CheR family methyltransferase [Blastocatellia bacterium]